MITPIAAWLDVAADEKADSVTRLAPEDIKTVIEIGCGTGAVLAALGRRGFAEEYWACEPARELAEQIPRERIARLQDVQVTTLDRAFPGRSFDLAILSHVVEHLLAPAALVHEALNRARYVLIEVPIEFNVSGRARMAIKRAAGHDPLRNPAGHVQFFSRRSARLLVQHAGGDLLGQRGYFPRSPYAAQATRSYQRVVLAMSRCEPIARTYYEHFAMLAHRSHIEEWDHHYARPV